MQPMANRAGSVLRDFHLGFEHSRVRIHHEYHQPGLGQQVTQQFDAFGHQVHRQEADPGHIASWTAQALHHTHAHRVPPHGENNGNA